MTVLYGSTHATLARLEGTWEGQGELLPSSWGPAGLTAATWHFRLDHSRMNLIHGMVEQRSDGSVFEGNGIMTVDPTTDEVLWFWVDGHGYPPLKPHRGRWDGVRLCLLKSTPRGEGRTTFEVAGARLTCRVESRAHGDAAFAPVMLGSFARKSRS